MKKDKNYLKAFDIQFGGLKVGVHEYEFSVDKSFFEGFESVDIEDGELRLSFILEKQENLLTLHFNVSGFVVQPCGRCTEPMRIPMEFEERMLVKFTTEDLDTEEILTLPPQAHSLNIAPVLEELITVHVPLNATHENEADCNQEYLEYIAGSVEDDTEETEEEIDPRWEALKNLKKD